MMTGNWIRWVAVVLVVVTTAGMLGSAMTHSNDCEIQRLRKQVTVLKALVEDYRQELAHVDGLNAELQREKE